MSGVREKIVKGGGGGGWGASDVWCTEKDIKKNLII